MKLNTIAGTIGILGSLAAQDVDAGVYVSPNVGVFLPEANFLNGVYGAGLGLGVEIGAGNKSVEGGLRWNNFLCLGEKEQDLEDRGWEKDIGHSEEDKLNVNQLEAFVNLRIPLGETSLFLGPVYGYGIIDETVERSEQELTSRGENYGKEFEDRIPLGSKNVEYIGGQIGIEYKLGKEGHSVVGCVKRTGSLDEEDRFKETSGWVKYKLHLDELSKR